MKILIADDHSLFREGIQGLLRGMDQSLQVVEAGTLDEAIARALETPDLDCILLDLQMPGMDGLEGLRRLRSQVSDVPVVIVSASEEPERVAAAIRAGAAGFVPKSSKGKVMIGALHLVVNQGGIYVPPAVLAEPAPEPARAPRQRHPDRSSEGLASLTQRQLEVLRLMGEGRSNRAIASELRISDGTVKNHVAVILKALGVSSRAEAAVAAVRMLQ